MEVKVACGCGQKYKFDVEPVNGRMPVAVSCPVCGVDGTPMANGIIAQTFSSQPPQIPVAMAMPAAAAAPVGGLRINHTRACDSQFSAAFAFRAKAHADATGCACRSKCKAGQ